MPRDKPEGYDLLVGVSCLGCTVSAVGQTEVKTR